MPAYKDDDDALLTGDWILMHLETLDPWIVGPRPMPVARRIKDDWDYHGGQGDPSTEHYRYAELVKRYGEQDVQLIPEVRRLIEAIWSLG